MLDDSSNLLSSSQRSPDWARFIRLRDDQVPTRLSRRDVEDLRWYFRVGGPAAFQCSTLGPQLAMAELFSNGSLPCEECGGSIRDGAPGTGYVPGDLQQFLREQAAERKRWRDCGWEPPADLPPPLTHLHERCKRCGGLGWAPTQLPRMPQPWPAKPSNANPTPLTAWEERQFTAVPTGSSIKSRDVAASIDIDEVDLARIGVVGRRLARVAALDGRAVQALDAFFGDEAGRLYHVYPLVPAGQKLLKRARHRTKERDDPLSPAQIVETEILLEKLRSKPNRRLLLERAEEQAEALFLRASRIWNRVVHGDDILARLKLEADSLVERFEARKGAA